MEFEKNPLIAKNLRIEEFPLQISSILDREINEKFAISGSDSLLSLALVITQSHSKAFDNRVNVVVVTDLDEANRLRDQVRFFDPNKNIYIFNDKLKLIR